MYFNQCLSSRQVDRLVSNLKKMANPILNDKLRPGAPRAASSEARLGIITDIITNDCRLNSEQIAVIIGISSCTVL